MMARGLVPPSKRRGGERDRKLSAAIRPALALPKPEMAFGPNEAAAAAARIGNTCVEGSQVAQVTPPM